MTDQSRDFNQLIPIPKKHWVNYPVAENLLAHILYLVNDPNPYRAEGCLVVGHPENGKTFLLLHAYKLVINQKNDNNHSETNDSNSPRVTHSRRALQKLDQTPAIYIQAPVEANARYLFETILKRLHVPLPARIHMNRLIDEVLYAIGVAGVKVIFVDELHNVVSGSLRGHRVAIEYLKFISNECGIPIIAAGTDRALNAINLDDQYYSRFPPIQIPLWKLDRDYLGLLRAFENITSVAQGTFTGRVNSQAIFMQCGGRIARVVKLINKIVLSMRSRKTCELTREMIEESANIALNFIPGKDRPA